MNLLVLSTWFPYPADNGSRLRAFHLIRALAAAGHRVRLVAGIQEDVAASVREEGIPGPLREICDQIEAVPWRWYQPRPQGALRSLLSMTPRSILETAKNAPLRAAIARGLTETPVDVVLALEQAMAPFVPEDLNAPAVLEQMEFTGWYRACRASRGAARVRHHLTAWKAERYWGRALRRFQAVTVVSEEEASAVRRILGSGAGVPPVVVVPNGVDVSAYAPSGAGRDAAAAAATAVVPGRLMYNGALSYRPNLDAVRWFAAEILPLVAARVPQAHLVVTGREPKEDIGDLRANPRVHLTGFVPDLRPELEKSALCVVPLLAGGGTRLKVLEAFAAHLPVVSTTVGAAGLPVRHGEHLLLADAAGEFAEAVAGLLGDANRAAALARQARSLVEARFDWRAIGEDLSNLLAGVSSSAAASSSSSSRSGSSLLPPGKKVEPV